jgi:hypothetical protein
MTDLSLLWFNRSIREPTMTCKPMLPPVPTKPPSSPLSSGKSSDLEFAAHPPNSTSPVTPTGALRLSPEVGRHDE